MNFYLPALNLPLVLETSLRISVVLLAFLLLRPWLRGRIGGTWLGVISMLILARLLVPLPFESEWGAKQRALSPLRSTSITAQPIARPLGASVIDGVGDETAVTTPQRDASAPDLASGKRSGKIAWLEIWLVGVALGLVGIGVRAGRTIRLARLTEAADDQRLLAVFQTIPEALRRGVGLRETDDVDVPTLAGVFRPNIWMPRAWLGRLADEELRHILLHELGHARRRDLWVGCLFSLAVVVHWFNPLVWLAAVRARHDREFACDAWVLARVRDVDAADYGGTLLKTAALLRRRVRHAPNAVAVVTSSCVVSKRIEEISRGGRSSALAGIAGVLLAGGFLCFLTTNPHAGQVSGIAAGSFPPPPIEPVQDARHGLEAVRVPGAASPSLSLFCAFSPIQWDIMHAQPETFEQLYRPVMHRALDEHGEGIEWSMVHWIEVHDPPMAGDSAPLPATFRFGATAHIAVIREFWTYERTIHGKFRKKEWVRRTVAHVTAGSAEPVMQVSARMWSNGRLYSEFDLDARALSNADGPVTILWEGKPIATVDVSWETEMGRLTSSGKWSEAGRMKERQVGQFACSLGWSFAVWEERPSFVEDGAAWPESRPDFKLPPFDLGASIYNDE